MGNPERRITCLKYSLFAYNFLGFLLGVTMLGLGIWLFADWDIKYFLNTLEMTHFNNGTAVLLTAAIFSIIIVFSGCFGAVVESPAALLIFGITSLCCTLFEIAGAAYLLDHGTIWSQGTFWLKNRFYQLVYETTWKHRSYELMRVIQEHVGCCGSYNSRDYDNVHIQVPNECRDPVTGNEWQYGCHEMFSHYLAARAGPIAGIALALVIVQVLAAISALHMRKLVKKVNKGSAMYKSVPRSG